MDIIIGDHWHGGAGACEGEGVDGEVGAGVGERDREGIGGPGGSVHHVEDHRVGEPVDLTVAVGSGGGVIQGHGHPVISDCGMDACSIGGPIWGERALVDRDHEDVGSWADGEVVADGGGRGSGPLGADIREGDRGGCGDRGCASLDDQLIDIVDQIGAAQFKGSGSSGDDHRAFDGFRGDRQFVAIDRCVEGSAGQVNHSSGGAGAEGDGAAAVVCVGDEHPLAAKGKLKTVASRSRLYPNSQHIMGWDVGSHGFKILLDPGVPQIVEDYFADDVRRFLTDHKLAVSDVTSWISHPGGPKVLKAIEACLALPQNALEVSWDRLAALGNLSSASVLNILNETFNRRDAGGGQAGENAMLMAMGPGFCSELVLCQWS